MIPEQVIGALDRIKQYCTGLGIGTSGWDDELLLTTFIHKSYAADFRERQEVPHNERLEFLGDSVLGCIIADFLYNDFPHDAESRLTLAKIALVQEKTLAEAARDIALGEYMFLGKGEKKSGGADKDAVLSDGLEALIAYIYLVDGIEITKNFIRSVIYSYRDKAVVPFKSHKSAFQELVQKHLKIIPEYKDEEEEVESSGNVLVYKSTVYVGDTILAEGYGPSKKKAQEEAAKEAFLRYEHKE